MLVYGELPGSLLRQVQQNTMPSSSIANTAGLAEDRAWAEKQAQKQMDFQERMSNTAYQRAIEDLQKAGLNPALAYSQGGASSAVGASASTSSTEQHAHLQAQREMFGVLNSALGVASRAIKLAQ